jgi:hypothetical protein
MLVKSGVHAGVIILFILVAAVSLAAQEFVWGTCTAELTSDPGYEGYWKYCIDMGWDVTGYDGHGLSHVDVFLGLEDCECVCSEGYFAFTDTVGSGPGTLNGGPCTVYWHGTFNCEGDPTIPDGVPLIKFQYFEGECEPDKAGSASVCFYSVASPVPAGTFIDAFGIKFGPYFEKGDLVGVLPSCDTAHSVTETSVWGRLKALFR